MQKKLPQTFLATILFLSFALFSLLVAQGSFRQVDFTTTVWLQRFLSRALDVPLSLLSLTGSFEVATVVLLAILLLRKKRFLVAPLSLYVSLHVVELLGKKFILHLGPPFMFYRYSIPFFFPSTGVKPGYSYPSGHSARGAFLAALVVVMVLRSKTLSVRQKTILAMVAVLYALLMFTSRVYLGEHWVSDVIGGALLGASFGLFAPYFFKVSEKLGRRSRGR